MIYYLYYSRQGNIILTKRGKNLQIIFPAQLEYQKDNRFSTGSHCIFNHIRCPFRYYGYIIAVGLLITEQVPDMTDFGVMLIAGVLRLFFQIIPASYCLFSIFETNLSTGKLRSFSLNSLSFCQRKDWAPSVSEG